MKRLNGENFDRVVDAEQGLFIIKFFSQTCGPCQTMNPVFQVLEEKNPDLNIYEIDTMESPELAAHFGVRGVPFIAYCENREVLYEFTGVTPLANLQFVVDRIDDPYFRENGEFQKNKQKKTWWYEGIVATLIIIYLIVFLK